VAPAKAAAATPVQQVARAAKVAHVATAASGFLRPHESDWASLKDNPAGELSIGVLALQGAFAEHRVAFERLGATVQEVRRPEHLNGVQAIAFPGGESTTMSKLLATSGLFEILYAKIHAGFPVFGTCAGMILLATEILDGRPDQVGFSALDASVRRNGYGRQVDSFEAEMTMPCLVEPTEPVQAVFIRAPKFERVGAGVEVLGAVDRVPVVVRQGNVLAAAFHPEMTAELRIHRYFVEQIVRPSVVG
jgi:pyridoxal 5'-phosphate synthase pdxT subunit